MTEILYQFDIATAEFIQNIYSASHAASPVLGELCDAVFLFFTFFGEQLPIILILAAVYWGINKKSGEFLIMNLFLALSANGVIKDSVRRLRPFQNEKFSRLRYVSYDGALINTADLSESFSFPSGHSQCAVSLYDGIAFLKKKLSVTIAAAAIIIAVMLSRVYLGVHFPSDVIGGAIISLTLTFVFAYLYERLYEKRYYLFAFAVAINLAGFFVELSDDTVKTAAIGCGMLVGMLLENRFVRFTVDGKPSERVLRSVLGLLLLALIRLIFKLLLPDSLVFDAAAYLLIGFTATYLYPLIFTQIKTHRTKPQ